MIRFEYRAWHVLSLCEQFVGFWPYQRKIRNFALRIFDASIISSYFFALILRLIEEWNDNLHIVVENFFLILSLLIVLIKIAAIFTLDKRRKKIFDQIAAYFKTIVDKDEIQILRDYSEKGLRFTIVSLFLMGFATLIFLVPVIRMFFLYFFGGQSLEKKLPLYLDFLIDEQEYFFCIVALLLFGLMYGATVDFTFDLNFFLTVRHICALFQIVKLRLYRASEFLKQIDENNQLPDEDEARAYELISSAVDLHNEASEMTELLDEAYKVSWLFILLLNAIAFAPIPVMVMLYEHDTYELCRRLLASIVYPVHFYIIFVQGQMTIDYSESVYDSCYEFCWYDAPKQFQLTISIMMTRSLKPSRLTGVLFDLSMETYSVMLKTALSYISVFQALDM